ncbi:HigA family addiction module antitoxin [Dyella sp. C9]|uniref:HigA family addiction module antitoxin n=1 Tax=Dyella sp. C9 TaxID=2202154 RepID=UPI000DEF2408|nr:HigA family addiction module antitoxin [Dyella sp. C9]
MTDIIQLHPNIEIAQPLPVRHPGKVLKEDFMKPRQLTIPLLAEQSGLDAWRISTVLTGTHPIRANTAFRLAKVLGTSPHYWLLLQLTHEILLEQRLRDMRVKAHPSEDAEAFWRSLGRRRRPSDP